MVNGGWVFGCLGSVMVNGGWVFWVLKTSSSFIRFLRLYAEQNFSTLVFVISALKSRRWIKS